MASPLLLLPLPPRSPPKPLTPKPSSTLSPTSLTLREHLYHVLEILPDGSSSPQSITRRQLLQSSGLRLRDLRCVDPSLSLLNSSPSLLVRDRALLLIFGSLRAIAMPHRLLLFDPHRPSPSSFLRSLLPRLSSPSPPFPFELEVLEAALLSRIQTIEHRLIALNPRLAHLLLLLPNRLTAHLLEDLRLSKQTLVQLASRARAIKQMLLDLLEDPHEIRRICVMGRAGCVLRDAGIECEAAAQRQVAQEEEEEIELLLENYLLRCESCHGQAERLLDCAREMEDSIAVSLSSRRLEVSRVELLLQVGTFCVAVGALVAGIFGMNLRSYLEEHVFAFWMTTGGILVGAVAGFFVMYYYLRAR